MVEPLTHSEVVAALGGKLLDDACDRMDKLAARVADPDDATAGTPDHNRAVEKPRTFRDHAEEIAWAFKQEAERRRTR